MVMADFPYSKIAIMHLFLELKQKFPAIPDQVVKDCIYQNSFNRLECEEKLYNQYQRYLLHSYPYSDINATSIFSKMTEDKERPKTLAFNSNAEHNNNMQEINKIMNSCEENKTTSNDNHSNKKIIDLVEKQFKTLNCQSNIGYNNLSFSDDNINANATVNFLNANHVSPEIENFNKSALICGKCCIANDTGVYHKTAFSDTVLEDNRTVSSRDLESIKNIEISNNHSNLMVTDLKLRFQNDNCGCEKTSLSVEYHRQNPGTSHSAPTTPLSGQKSINDASNIIDQTNATHNRRSLNVDSEIVLPPWSASDINRPVMSVNLTLRQPSSEIQPPINIATKGPNLMYSTSTYRPNQGYQDQLKISINEEGNTTLSASRTKVSSGIPVNNADGNCFASDNNDLMSINELSPALELRLYEQMERKNRLEIELKLDEEKLEQMKEEVATMEKDLENRRRMPIVSEKVLKLRTEVRALRIQCNVMIQLLDKEEQSMNSSSHVAENNSSSDNSQHWECHLCSFKNHPELPKCEVCEMKRLDTKTMARFILERHTSNRAMPPFHNQIFDPSPVSMNML